MGNIWTEQGGNDRNLKNCIMRIFISFFVHWTILMKSNQRDCKHGAYNFSFAVAVNERFFMQCDCCIHHSERVKKQHETIQ